MNNQEKEDIAVKTLELWEDELEDSSNQARQLQERRIEMRLEWEALNVAHTD